MDIWKRFEKLDEQFGYSNKLLNPSVEKYDYELTWYFFTTQD